MLDVAGVGAVDTLREDAFRFARQAHARQRRETDSAPYVHHPVDVADLLEEAGYGQEVVAAALLHDVVEDSEAGIEDVTRRFGARVAALVSAMTEDPRIEGYEQRKAEHRERIAASGPDATAIFLADKLAKARELSRALSAGDDDLEGRLKTPLEAKLRHYEQTLKIGTGSPAHERLARELREELVRLRAQAGADGSADGSGAQPV